MLAISLGLALTLQVSPHGAPAGAAEPSLAGGARAARLLAQAPALPAPPLTQAGEDGVALRRRLVDLNTELRLLDTNWPASSIVLVVVGGSIAPLALPGLYLVLAGGLSQSLGLQLGLGSGLGAAAGFVVAAGVVTLALGTVGAVLLVVGIVQGIRQSEQAKERRERLLGERVELEERLRRLEPPPPPAVPIGPTTGGGVHGARLAVTVARF